MQQRSGSSGGRTRSWTKKLMRRTDCLYAALCFAACVCLCNGSSNDKGIARVSVEEQQKRIADKNLECQIFILEHPPLLNNYSFCPPVWDTLTCWPATRAGTVAEKPCPDYIDKFKLDQNATRTCTEEGRWYVNPDTNETWTNFTRCVLNQPSSPISHLIRSHMGWIRLMYNINYGISLVSLVLAVLIMLCFKRLHCARNTIHLNLFASFILRASISFMKENLLVEGLGFPSDVIETSDGVIFKPSSLHWECKLFFTTFHYVLGANYMWIFVEALYLHMLITVAVFSERSGIKYYVLFGWVMPLSFVIPWVVVRATREDIFCWNTHPTEYYFWIMKGPIVASIAISFVLFLSIIRVLYVKLSAVNSQEAKKFRKLAKSTLVLVPLFGVHYIVFLGLPKDVGERTELVKLYFEMFFNSIQGFFVALLFCFLNGEVQTEIRKTWTRFQLSHPGYFQNICCKGRTSGSHVCNTYATYMTRARASFGSLQHMQDVRNKKPATESCRNSRLLMEETPLNSYKSDSLAERQPLTNGRDVYVRGSGGALEQPILSNGSSSNEGCGKSLMKDEYRVN